MAFYRKSHNHSPPTASLRSAALEIFPAARDVVYQEADRLRQLTAVENDLDNRRFDNATAKTLVEAADAKAFAAAYNGFVQSPV